MIKNLLHQLSIGYLQGEDRVNAIRHYMDMMEHPGWETHEQFLMEIINGINNYMFGKEYTNLDKDAKDLQQRVFYEMKNVLQFLVNPLAGANKYTAIQRHNKKVGTQPKKKSTK